MVVLSLEAYAQLTEGIETALDEADRMASENEERYTHDEGKDKIMEVRRFLYNKQNRQSFI